VIAKKIAVITGGAGFIGSHVADILLKNNFEVRIIDNLSGGNIKNISKHLKNKKLIFKKKNICSIKSNDKVFKNVKYIFHFAGKGDIVPSIENPYEYFNTNVLGTIKILEAAKINNIKKFIYAASSSCYGLAKTPTSEKNPIQTLYPYALSKYQGEQCVLHWGQVYNLPVISIRIFNAYGPRVKTTGAYGAVFGVFFKQKLEKKPFTIVGNGNQKRDFLYVTDLAQAFIELAKSSRKGEIYNLGAGKPQTINKLVKLLGDKYGKSFLPTRPGEPFCTWASIKKIKKHTKWKPKVDFKLGVSNMLKDINEWKDAPLWNAKSINRATKTWFKFMRKKK